MYIFEFDTLAIVRADSETEAREIYIAMISAADLTAGTAGTLAPLDNYTVYDEAGDEIDLAESDESSSLTRMVGDDHRSPAELED